MRNNILSFLSAYSNYTIEVDKLIVSAFLNKRGITTVNNTFLGSYIIHNDEILAHDKLIQFIELVDKEQETFEFEDLIKLFEFVISPADRIVNGAIYTPIEIRNFIVDSCVQNFEENNLARFADIACGCGGFLLSVAKTIKQQSGKDYFEIFRDNIFGLDIQGYSTVRTKLLLSLLALTDGEDQIEYIFNIFTGDALSFNWHDHIIDFNGFEAIIGNPPYVSCRNLDPSTKELLQNWRVARSGNPDLYIPFFQIGIENLAENGVLGFITMNTFFKSLNGRDLRSYFQDLSLSFRIIDFGSLQVFKSRNTYTCICLIRNQQDNAIEYHKALDIKLLENIPDFERINYEQLDARNGWNLDNHITISLIEATGTPFGNLFKTRHGIATLKNDIYIFRPEAEDDSFYYFRDADLFPIEKNICRDIVNSNKLSRPNDLADLKEKIIFPYDDAQRPRLLDEKKLATLFPMAYKYLLRKKGLLAMRDKGEGDYEQWFAYGRTQSLEKITHKLFFPKYSDNTPSFIINNDQNLLFYNGLAVIAENEEDLLLARKIMQTKLFWFYIRSTSKPYSSNYYSLNGNYIKNFGVYNFTNEQRNFIINEADQNLLDDFFENLYGLQI